MRHQQAAGRGRRPAMRSPGRPYPAREVERAFWQQIALGVGSETAAVAVGVSAPVGSRWFRQGGGMSPLSLTQPTGRYLSLTEREDIGLRRAAGMEARQIARELNCAPSTISRDSRRTVADTACLV